MTVLRDKGKENLKYTVNTNRNIKITQIYNIKWWNYYFKLQQIYFIKPQRLRTAVDNDSYPEWHDEERK